ncbi:hypothetical protein OG749_03920 [Streptomyces nojiriensis]|uniref:hypothetical protein n=1 Tax=Streptomyces nojiriensis TaxID=66374 RepID=UPI002E18BF32
MNVDDGKSGGRRPWQRSPANNDPEPVGPEGPGARMPDAVKNLRVLMMVLGGMQAVLGIALVTNSVAVATSIWGDGDASTPCCTTPGEDHAGTVVFVGLLVLGVSAWGVTTALKFATRQRNLRVSAIAFGWTALPFSWAFFQVIPLLGFAWLVPAILAIVRPNQPESRAWFNHRPL